MGRGRTLCKTPRTRPKKKPRERRRREKNQRERLLKLGLTSENIRTLNSKEVRTLLKRPMVLVEALSEG